MASFEDSLEAFLSQCVALIRKVHNGRYAVHRGAVNWAAWPFDSHPFAWNVTVDETALFPVADANGVGSPAIVTFEIFVKGNADKADFGIDDGINGELRRDARDVIVDLIRSRRADEPGEPLVYAVHQPSVRAVEALDAALAVQGVIVYVPIHH